MDTTSMIALLVSIVTGVSSICAIIAFVIKQKNSVFQNGKYDGEIRGDIKYMRNSFDDLRLDVKEMARKQDAQSERITRVEERCDVIGERLSKVEKSLEEYRDKIH